MVQKWREAIVPQRDLVSTKTLSQYLHCWSLMGIEKMILKSQFMRQPSKEGFLAANKMKLFFFFYQVGLLLFP